MEPLTFFVSTGRRKFIVRPPVMPEEHVELMEVEKEIWGNDYREVVPYHVTIPLADMGGVVLGVYEIGSGKAVGVLVMFPAYVNGKVHYHSHILGFLKEYRGIGLGTKVKLIQREISLKRGIKLITWTYDPLLLSNAWLNIVKMGVVPVEYKINYYGIGSFEYNRGIETDRFLVEWHLDSKRVIERLEKGKVWKPLEHYMNIGASTTLEAEDLREGEIKIDLLSRSNVLLVRIPNDFAKMIGERPKRAKEWRLKSRLVLTHYMRRGYLVADITKDSRESRYYYVLWKVDKKRVLEGELP